MELKKNSFYFEIALYHNAVWKSKLATTEKKRYLLLLFQLKMPTLRTATTK